MSTVHYLQTDTGCWYLIGVPGSIYVRTDVPGIKTGTRYSHSAIIVAAAVTTITCPTTLLCDDLLR